MQEHAALLPLLPSAQSNHLSFAGLGVNVHRSGEAVPDVRLDEVPLALRALSLSLILLRTNSKPLADVGSVVLLQDLG